MKKSDKRKALVSKMSDMLEFGKANNCHGMFAWERMLTTAQYFDLKLTKDQLKQDVIEELIRRGYEPGQDNFEDQTKRIPFTKCLVKDLV